MLSIGYQQFVNNLLMIHGKNSANTRLLTLMKRIIRRKSPWCANCLLSIGVKTVFMMRILPVIVIFKKRKRNGACVQTAFVC